MISLTSLNFNLDNPERDSQGDKMSIECEICGKKPITGHNVSHSHRKTKRRWLPNLQWFKKEDGTRVKACTRCIKTASKVK